MTPGRYSMNPQSNPEWVFGRAGVLAWLRKELIAGQSVTLIGIRRIGVSTILKVLSVDAALSADGVVCLYFDLQRYRSSDAFSEAVIDALTSVDAGTNRTPPTPRTAAEPDRFLRIQAALHTLKTSQGRTPILLFDHFDRQVGELLDKNAIDSWRALIDKRLASIVTTYAGPFRLRKETHYYNNSVKKRVGFLDADAVRAMLSAPLAQPEGRRFDERESAWIARMGGLHPYFLTVACRSVLQARDGTGSEQDCDDAFALDAGGQYNRYLDELTPEQVAEVGAVAFHTIPKPKDFDVDALCVRQGNVHRLFSESFEDFVRGRVQVPADVGGHSPPPAMGRPSGSPPTAHVPGESGATPPVVFLSYSHEDGRHLKKLEQHLSVLKRQHVIDTWTDRRITAGMRFDQEIDERINEAKVVLLLVSPSFVASDYSYGIEMKRALERHRSGEAVVIPIILRDVDFAGSPLGTLTALPTDARPVSSRHWQNQDEAYADVVRGIRRVVETLHGPA